MSAKCKQALREERDKNQQYDISSEAITSGSVSNSDAKKLVNAKAYLPSDWSESNMQRKQYGVWLAVLLGTQHANVQAHFDAIDLHEEIEAEIQFELDASHGSKLAPALYNFSWHLHHRSWFERQWQSTQTRTLPPPDITAGLLLYQSQNRVDWMPRHDNIPLLKLLTKGVRLLVREYTSQ